MLENNIYKLCKQLRLSQNLAEMAMEYEGATHQEYLVKLLTQELKNREISRITKLINTAGFYTIKSIKNFRFDEVTLPSDLTIESLLTLDFIHEKKSNNNIYNYDVCIGPYASPK